MIGGTQSHMVESNLDNQLQKRISNWLERTSQQCQIIEPEGTAVALGSSIGIVRKENQDRVLFLRAKIGRSSKRAFVAAVLCDGLGGMAHGGQCANLAISVFVTSLIRSQEPEYKKQLEVAVKQANEAVFREFSGTGGATLSAIIYDESNVLFAVNVGDSRIYQVSRDGKVDQLSIDDTLEGQLAALKHLPQSRSPELKQLVQYIGMGEGLEPRHVNLNSLSDIRAIILTSDGAHSTAKDIFQTIINNAKHSKDIVNRLISLSEWLGGRDNATVVAVSTNAGLGLRTTDAQTSELIELWSPVGKVEFWSPSVLQQLSAEQKGIQKPPVKKEQLRSTQKRRKQELEKKDKNNDKDEHQGQQISSKDTKHDAQDYLPPLKIDISDEDF